MPPKPAVRWSSRCTGRTRIRRTPTSCRGRADAWLPQGEWFDFFDGRRYVSSDAAGRRLEVWRSLDRTPVFAKAGAIVPLQDVAESGEAINSIANPQALRVLVFPGADGSFVMREDRGTWGAPSADTAIAFPWGGRYVRRTRVARLDGRVPRRRAG